MREFRGWWKWAAGGVVGALVVAAPAAGQGVIPDRTAASPIPNRNASSPIPFRAGAIGDPATAASSIYQNMQGRYLGMGQQVVNRTADNAEGVYWNMTNARRSRERAVYGATGGVSPAVQQRLLLEQYLDFQREKKRLEEQTVEIKWRQDIRNRIDQGPGAATAFPGADMLRRPGPPALAAQAAPAAMAAAPAPAAPAAMAAPNALAGPAAPAAPAAPAGPPIPAVGYDYAANSVLPMEPFVDPTPIPSSMYGPLGGYLNHMKRFPNMLDRRPGFYERSPNLPERAPAKPDRDPIERDR